MTIGNIDLWNTILIAASVLTAIGVAWLCTLALPRRRSRGMNRAAA